jgi:amino acid transporter
MKSTKNRYSHRRKKLNSKKATYPPLFLVILILIAFAISFTVPTLLFRAAVTVDMEYPVVTPIDPASPLPHPPLEDSDIRNSFIFNQVLPFCIDYAIKLAVALSVVIIILGGYQFMTAYGNTEKHKKAKRTITYALIGLILSLTAYGIIFILTSIQLS